jgi:YNFM family putative membrane transporter
VNLRTLAVASCGASAFLDMYATQPLLPELRTAFAASEAAVSSTISTLTFGCALAAPFVGGLADRFGRKRIIVGAILGLGLVTLAAASATTLAALVAWRFVQGLFMPAVFAVTLAYIAEEFTVEVGGRIVGAYIAGNVLGGFLGRYVAAVVASRFDWHAAFVVLGCMNFVGGTFIWIALPRAAKFVRSTSLAEMARAIGGFVRDPVFLATCAIGGSVLFTLVASFTYATFYLHEPPFGYGTLALGNVFFVYLMGVVAAPIAGRMIDRFGHRFTLLVATAAGAIGVLLTLSHAIVAVVAGLALTSTSVFCSQAASQGFVGRIASTQRSTAASLYLMVYYVGGGLGAIVPSLTWSHGGWPPTVALIVAVQAAVAGLALGLWPGRIAATPA